MLDQQALILQNQEAHKACMVEDKKFKWWAVTSLLQDDIDVAYLGASMGIRPLEPRSIQSTYPFDDLPYMHLPPQPQVSQPPFMYAPPSPSDTPSQPPTKEDSFESWRTAFTGSQFVYPSPPPPPTE